MSYKYLNLNYRNKIEVLKQEGYSSRRVTKFLGFVTLLFLEKSKGAKKIIKLKKQMKTIILKFPITDLSNIDIEKLIKI